MYFVLETTETTEGVRAQSVFAFEDLKAAKSNYHYFLSSSLANTAVDYCMASISDETGNVVLRESWYAPQPEPVAQ